jgi:AcrR family transcriptional regulator
MTTAGSGNVARSLELMWQGDVQARPGPRPGLTLGQIVVAAVALADREGLSALSMRRVAGELGVGTMSLYRYVPGKGELLDLMLDHVSGMPDDAPDPRSLPWRQLLEEMATGIWDLYQAHPWLLHVNQSRPVLGPNTLAGLNYALAGLADLHLDGRDRIAIILTVESYVLGTARAFLLREHAAEESGVSDEEFWAAQEQTLEKAMATGNYPEVASLSEDAFAITGREALEFGLRPLLDGLEPFLAARARGRPTRPRGRGRPATPR